MPWLNQHPKPGCPNLPLLQAQKVLLDGHSQPSAPCPHTLLWMLFPQAQAADENRNAPLWMRSLGKCFSSNFHDRFEFLQREGYCGLFLNKHCNQ